MCVLAVSASSIFSPEAKASNSARPDSRGTTSSSHCSSAIPPCLGGEIWRPVTRDGTIRTTVPCPRRARVRRPLPARPLARIPLRDGPAPEQYAPALAAGYVDLVDLERHLVVSAARSRSAGPRPARCARRSGTRPPRRATCSSPAARPGRTGSGRRSGRFRPALSAEGTRPRLVRSIVRSDMSDPSGVRAWSPSQDRSLVRQLPRTRTVRNRRPSTRPGTDLRPCCLTALTTRW